MKNVLILSVIPCVEEHGVAAEGNVPERRKRLRLRDEHAHVRPRALPRRHRPVRCLHLLGVVYFVLLGFSDLLNNFWSTNPNKPDKE